MAEVTGAPDDLLLIEHHCPICEAAEACAGSAAPSSACSERYSVTTSRSKGPSTCCPVAHGAPIGSGPFASRRPNLREKHRRERRERLP